MSVVSILKESIRLAGEAGITVCIWGHRGIGKSQIIQQITTEGDGEILKVYKKDGKPVPLGTNNADDTINVRLPIGLIDYRCSQIEASDVRGLPDKVYLDGESNGRTTYLPPLEMPIADMTSADIYRELALIKDPADRVKRSEELQPRYERGILFLDEINRAQDDVLQAIFQLLLDLRIGMYVLPQGWRIAVACNFMEGDYITNGFNDAALLDRMCHLVFSAGEGTIDDWTRFMADKHGEHASSAIEFCASNTDFLVGQVQGDLGFSVQPSPRSWDRVATIERIAASKYSEAARYMVISGLVGQAAAIAYNAYSCPVKPRDILLNGVDQYRKELAKLDRGQLLSICWGMVAVTRGKLDDDNVIDICLDLSEVLLSSDKITDKDVVVGFLRALVGDAGDDSGDQIASCLTNWKLADTLLQFYVDLSPFISRLAKRTELHKTISTAGWGQK